jgi:mono/diheme cytochrome c family protein
MKNYSPFIFMVIFSLIIASNIGCSQNNKNSSSETSEKSNGTIQDSSYNQNSTGRKMMGNGRMSGSMGAGGMMANGNMTGRGNMMGSGMMMNQGNNSNIQGGSWIAPKSAEKLKNPVAGIAEATKKGQNIFNTQCAVCHGEKGIGNGIAGASLHPHPANLTADSVQSQSDGAIYWKITTGNSPMASYKNSLSDKERWDLVNYIRKLGKK